MLFTHKPICRLTGIKKNAKKKISTSRLCAKCIFFSFYAFRHFSVLFIFCFVVFSSATIIAGLLDVTKVKISVLFSAFDNQNERKSQGKPFQQMFKTIFGQCDTIVSTCKICLLKYVKRNFLGKKKIAN